ncbi:TPA: hypothetical protein ACQTXZ_002535 [Pseudomonas aeruginosa]|uniref:hypothetical protein n=1 Tax=Pseudomonas aeruginosa TaxID=287 RepID=UPI0004647032|nr:hypothetical protein [Pseudomonas aeruginosa]EIU1678502.1 hypothetical protein [Pseudomonas aeruginosa]EKV4566055.1 hypothetical protein [Pseudomonas aeruginosa]MBH8871267.1 hypothetical protein [Pseudomonas aeruginosa]MBI8967649.1 hypothetical protein [Pseudomonas aeruginosa]MBY1011007.1 hypothetical protein [Pseudomonas aeruginosa]
MNVLRKCLGAPRRALCALAVRLLAKAAHLLMVLSVRAYASGHLSQLEVKYLLDCSSALNRASLRLARGG